MLINQLVSWGIMNEVTFLSLWLRTSVTDCKYWWLIFCLHKGAVKTLNLMITMTIQYMMRSHHAVIWVPMWARLLAQVPPAHHCLSSPVCPGLGILSLMTGCCLGVWVWSDMRYKLNNPSPVPTRALTELTPRATPTHRRSESWITNCGVVDNLKPRIMFHSNKLSKRFYVCIYKYVAF